MGKIRVVGKIVRINGECAARHHAGEEFDFTLFSEDKDKDIFLAGCPDNCKVVIELRRIRS